METIYEPLATDSYYLREHILPAPVAARRKAKIIVTNTKSAELIKHASNAFLAMKLYFAKGVQVCA